MNGECHMDDTHVSSMVGRRCGAYSYVPQNRRDPERRDELRRYMGRYLFVLEVGGAGEGLPHPKGEEAPSQ